MVSDTPSSGPFRTADLPQRRPIAFSVVPDASARDALATELGLLGLRKLTFDGEIRPVGKRGFHLTGRLGATLVQECVVTLAPVTTRIETEVARAYVPPSELEPAEAGAEVEMPEDETLEPLGEEIAPEAVMHEALALAVPEYPRAAEAEFEGRTAEPDGAAPIRDADLKPFAGLEALRGRLTGGDSGGGDA
ncbi:YceD family protein [Roseivivax sediminis]|uniref:Uncharacterized metal-binding protein YceD, DUF177 family n=1 Tax=Roseivivax sediminis TaxID=936889 RepID=A0A1I1WSN7_9RHOB|nr:DUF177 domain-containing protein [Roseivivax sediminis]SFD98177.1 Uncharacterized metal-binding protein YceD, DUF177 family [Roseivivax sediminis]